MIRQKYVPYYNKNAYDEAVAVLTASDGKMTYDEKQEALLRAVKNNREMEAYAAQRTEVIDLYIKANMIGTKYFAEKVLRGMEMPEYITKGRPSKIPIYYISDWLGAATTIWTDSRGVVTLPLGMVTSDIVKVPKRSLLQGQIDKSEEMNEDLAYSVVDKLDDMAWEALTAAIGAFDDNVFILDPKIKNAPTTNDLDFSAACDGKITKDFYKGIMDHFARLNLKIFNVDIPAVRLQDHLDWVSVSGDDIGAQETIPSNVQAKIWESGGLNLGAGWIPKISPTNVLEGEESGSIYCWVTATEPVGFMYTKPELDYTKTDDRDPVFYESHTVKTVTFAVPAPMRIRVARVKIG